MKRKRISNSEAQRILILGIGNILMGDEGVGARVAQFLSNKKLPDYMECLDGGTGTFSLLEPMQRAARIILIDAALDGNIPGAVNKLTPRFSKDYPRTLTAHDFGLKDLLDSFYLLDQTPQVTLFTITIAPPAGLTTELSPEIERVIPQVADLVFQEALAER